MGAAKRRKQLGEPARTPKEPKKRRVVTGYAMALMNHLITRKDTPAKAIEE
jgi:hypothetical protein